MKYFKFRLTFWADYVDTDEDQVTYGIIAGNDYADVVEGLAQQFENIVNIYVEELDNFGDYIELPKKVYDQFPIPDDAFGDEKDADPLKDEYDTCDDLFDDLTDGEEEEEEDNGLNQDELPW
jgi:hypothetical protein